jgi:hypothetical protein
MGRTKASASPAPKRRTSAAELAPRVLELLPARQAEIAKALERRPSDGTVRRALQLLEQEGQAERAGGVWRRCQELPPAAMPTDLDAEATDCYARTRAELEQAERWSDSKHDLLLAYARTLQDAREARAAVAEHGRYVKGPSGRVYLHPGVRDARDAERDAAAHYALLTGTQAGDGDDDGGGSADPMDELERLPDNVRPLRT